MTEIENEIALDRIVAATREIKFGERYLTPRGDVFTVRSKGLGSMSRQENGTYILVVEDEKGNFFPLPAVMLLFGSEKM